MARPRGVAMLALGVIALSISIAHFARFREFGLYEDDYYAIAPYLYKPGRLVWDHLIGTFSFWPQGRPLNHFLLASLSIVGSSFGGLHGAYVLAAVWLCLNGALVFLIVRRVLPDAPALVAAVVYVLFPADSTKILLTHAGCIQGSMTFLLLAIWLWMKGEFFRAFSYGVASLTLLTYETTFLPFIGVPLLWAGDRRATIRTWTVHIVGCIGTVASIALIRLSKGESRASEAVQDTGETIRRIYTSLYLGPFASGRSLLAAAADGWHYLDPYAVLVGALLVIGLVAAWGMGRRDNVSPAEKSGSPARALPWWWLLLGALVIWCGSYAFTLVNYPPTVTIGRSSSAHIAAAWPVSLAIAAVFEGVERRARQWRTAAVGLLAVWIIGLAGYHRYLQGEYVRAWHLQQSFWRQVTALVPNAGPGWTVIVDGIPSDENGKRPVIYSNSWADNYAYQLILTTDLHSDGPVFAHLGTYYGRGVQFRRFQDGIEWCPHPWGGPFVPIDPQRLALLHDDHGVLRRVPEIETPIGKLAAAVPERIGRFSWPSTTVSQLLSGQRSRRTAAAE